MAGICSAGVWQGSQALWLGHFLAAKGLNVKYSLTLMIDPDLHTAAKKFADKNNISFARLVSEALCAILAHKREVDPDLLGILQERMATHPGRQRLTEEELKRRWEAHDEHKAKKREERAKKFEAKAAALRGKSQADDDLVWHEGKLVKEEDLER